MVQLIEWSTKYHIGNFVIDHQHRRLVQLINSLNEISHQKLLNPYLLEAYYQDVKNYINFHFQTEENFMFTCHYSELEQHKKLHQNFVKQVSNLKIQSDQGLDPNGEKLCLFLKDWLLTHIAVEDVKMLGELVKGGSLPEPRKFF